MHPNAINQVSYKAMQNKELDGAAQIVEIGRRLYAKGFAAGNDGNLSIRADKNRVICTPTLVCKGFMSAKDLCTVDLEGKQLSGKRRRTSEILLHLEIYKQNPNARAVVHCHPPHATAFAIAGEQIPTGIIPEVEIFLGVVPLAPYETPGNDRFAATIRPFANNSTAVLLSNHGTVSWGATLEQAYWYTEILDAYCRMLILTKIIGGARRLPAEKVRELLALRTVFGMPADNRMRDDELFLNAKFASANQQSAPKTMGRQKKKKARR